MTKATKSTTKPKKSAPRKVASSPSAEPTSASSSIEQQLVQLRDLTQNEGCLHDGQILQLSYWTKIAVEGIKSDPSFAFDLENELLEIRIDKLNLKKKTKLFNKKLDVLSANIKWLLGEQFTVCIRVGKKAIYKSE